MGVANTSWTLIAVLTAFCWWYGGFVVAQERQTNTPAHLNLLPPPIEWCAEQPLWSAQARIDCSNKNASWALDAEMLAAKAQVSSVARLRQRRLKSKTKRDVVIIYIHAVMPEDHIGGILVLDKYLQAIRDSGLLAVARAVNVVAVGNITHVPLLLAQYEKMHLISNLASLTSFFEYPTVALMQEHARLLPKDARILFLTTSWAKTFTNKLRNFVRDAVLHYNIHLYQQSLDLLKMGYTTSGMLLVRGAFPHYSANMYWARAGKLAANDRMLDMVWRWGPGAEWWVFSSGFGCDAFATNMTIKTLNTYVRSDVLPLDIAELEIRDPQRPCVSVGL